MTKEKFKETFETVFAIFAILYVAFIILSNTGIFSIDSPLESWIVVVAGGITILGFIWRWLAISPSSPLRK